MLSPTPRNFQKSSKQRILNPMIGPQENSIRGTKSSPKVSPNLPDKRGASRAQILDMIKQIQPAFMSINVHTIV